MHRVPPDRRRSQSLAITLSVAALGPIPALAYPAPAPVVQPFYEADNRFLREVPEFTEEELRQVLYGKLDFSKPVSSILPEKSDLEKTLDFLDEHHREVERFRELMPTLPATAVAYGGPKMRDITVDVVVCGRVIDTESYDMKNVDVSRLRDSYDIRLLKWKDNGQEAPSLAEKKQEVVGQEFVGLKVYGMPEEFVSEEYAPMSEEEREMRFKLKLMENRERHPLMRGITYVSKAERARRMLNANPSLDAYKAMRGKSTT